VSDNLSNFTPPGVLKTAVLFLVFNRPDVTAQVFAEIKQARPPRLYVAADGPRQNRAGEAERCAEVRTIVSGVDWPCEVKTLFRDDNLGCKLAVSSAIDWFFEQEEQGIILEDDCLPSQSFFWFCESCLNRYKDDERIFLISGYNKQNKWSQDSSDYFFSNLGGIWGWASWRRCWNHYDLEMKDIDQFITANGFENVFGKELGGLRKNTIYNSIITNNLDTWDYQWGYARCKNNGLACVPSVSLIENIGFGDDATHTFVSNDDNVKRHDIDFPIKENVFVVPDRKYDELFLNKVPIWKRIAIKLNSLKNLLW
jgi:hypothetical protein